MTLKCYLNIACFDVNPHTQKAFSQLYYGWLNYSKAVRKQERFAVENKKTKKDSIGDGWPGL